MSDLAAGAMLFVISHEIIPETHRRGHENWATGGFRIGLLTMLSLDILLGLLHVLTHSDAMH